MHLITTCVLCLSECFNDLKLTPATNERITNIHIILQNMNDYTLQANHLLAV